MLITERRLRTIIREELVLSARSLNSLAVAEQPDNKEPTV